MARDEGPLTRALAPASRSHELAASASNSGNSTSAHVRPGRTTAGCSFLPARSSSRAPSSAFPRRAVHRSHSAGVTSLGRPPHAHPWQVTRLHPRARTGASPRHRDRGSAACPPGSCCRRSAVRRHPKRSEHRTRSATRGPTLKGIRLTRPRSAVPQQKTTRTGSLGIHETVKLRSSAVAVVGPDLAPTRRVDARRVFRGPTTVFPRTQSEFRRLRVRDREGNSRCPP